MKNYLINEKYRVFTKSSSSLGSQPKFFKDDYWYKSDFVGKEGLAEELVSLILKHSSIENYVLYEACKINNKLGCRSKNMLKKGEQYISFYDLYYNATGENLSDEILSIEDEKRFSFVVNFIENETNFDCTNYLFNNLVLDMLIRNPDRHFRNLGIIYTNDNKFREAPIFDNGQGLYQNYHITPSYLSVEEKESRICSCTISGSFEKQYLLAKESTGLLAFDINYKELFADLEGYENTSIKQDLCYLLMKYQLTFDNSDYEIDQDIQLS